MPSDPFDLQRFIAAQEQAYAPALAELRAAGAGSIIHAPRPTTPPPAPEDW